MNSTNRDSASDSARQFVRATGTTGALFLGIALTLAAIYLRDVANLVTLNQRDGVSASDMMGVLLRPLMDTNTALALIGAAWAGILTINVVHVPLELALSPNTSREAAIARVRWRDTLRLASGMFLATASAILIGLGISAVTQEEARGVLVLAFAIWTCLARVDSSYFWRREIEFEIESAKECAMKARGQADAFVAARSWVASPLPRRYWSPFRLSVSILLFGTAAQAVGLAIWVMCWMQDSGVGVVGVVLDVFQWLLWSAVSGSCAAMTFWISSQAVIAAAEAAPQWRLLVLVPAAATLALGVWMGLTYTDIWQRSIALLGLLASIFRVAGLVAWTASLLVSVGDCGMGV